MPPVGFKPTISVGERPQTNALDRATTGTGISVLREIYNTLICRNIRDVLKRLRIRSVYFCKSQIQTQERPSLCLISLRYSEVIILSVKYRLPLHVRSLNLLAF
jgi:hypothetical protein